MPRTTNKQPKLHVKKGDQVALTKAITSSEELAADRPKGYVARVLKVYPKKQRVLVEGVNVRYKHTKPNQQYPNGGRIEAERPIHISNVMPVDANGKPTRVGRKQVTNPDTGRSHWVRVARTTGDEIGR